MGKVAGGQATLQKSAIAIEVVGHVIVLIAEDSPRDKVSAGTRPRSCHQTTVEAVHKTLCICTQATNQQKEPKEFCTFHTFQNELSVTLFIY
jgi:hypothetical protein